MTFKLLAVACTALGLVATAAHAGSISTQTTPAGALALFGASDSLTFDSVAAGTYSTLTQGLLTFTSDSQAFHVDGDYNGSYNTFGGKSVHSCYCNDSFSELYFTFSQPVEGFGFFWGASDNQWTLTGYDAANAVVASFALPITHSSNAGDFVGIFAQGMTHATLAGPSSDYVFVDNVTFGKTYNGPGGSGSEGGGGTGVPEPATWAMMILGFGAVGLSLRGARRSALAV